MYLQYDVQFVQLPVARLVGTELADVVVVVVFEVVVVDGGVLVLFEVVVAPPVGGPTHMTCPTCMLQFVSSHGL
jgi:hypothetical protein